MKHPVQMSIQNSPGSVTVMFIDRARQQRIGRIHCYLSDDPVFKILRRAHANLETINIVELAMQQHRSFVVDLNLTDEQMAKLRR